MRDIMRFLIGAQASGSDKRYRGLTREKNTIRKQQEPRHRGRQHGVHPAERVREEPQVVGSRRPPEASPVHRHAELLDFPAGKVQSRPQRSLRNHPTNQANKQSEGATHQPSARPQTKRKILPVKTKNRNFLTAVP